MIPMTRLAWGAVGAALLFSLAAAAADTATLLDVSKNWSAFTSGSGSSKICYALSKPTATDPKKAKRDPIYFIITDWPGRSPKVLVARGHGPRRDELVRHASLPASPPNARRLGGHGRRCLLGRPVGA